MGGQIKTPPTRPRPEPPQQPVSNAEAQQTLRELGAIPPGGHPEPAPLRTYLEPPCPPKPPPIHVIKEGHIPPKHDPDAHPYRAQEQTLTDLERIAQLEREQLALKLETKWLRSRLTLNWLIRVAIIAATAISILYLLR